MEVIQMCNDDMDNEGISDQKLRRLSTLLTISDKIKKYPELQEITRIDTRHLEEHTLPKLRRLAHCMGITQPHNVPSKEQLIQRIVSIYESLKHQDVYEEDEYMIDVVSLHEKRVQRSLDIGEPLSYDSDDYYDSDSLRSIYSDYSVHFIEKRQKTVLSIKSMSIFFSRTLILLFLKHYRCFKNIQNQWYRYTNDTCAWEKVFVYDIDDFTLRVYERIESIAKLVDNELPRAFMATNNDIEGKYTILKDASIALQKCIKGCT